MYSPKFKILFVCLGNICRSPTAQGVMEKMLEQKSLQNYYEIDSAGTSAFHAGSPPDSRTIKAAEKRGYDLTKQKSRQVSFDDFEYFDLILAADKSNLANLLEDAPHSARAKIKLILDYSNSKTKEIPDPYHGGETGFEQVIDLIEDACKNIIEKTKP